MLTIIYSTLYMLTS